MPVAITKHRPPRLDVDEQKQQRPCNARPINPDPIACIYYLADPLQQLRNAQPENNGDDDRQISKLVHGFVCCMRCDTCRSLSNSNPQLHKAVRKTSDHVTEM